MQNDINNVKDHWNSHRIRGSRFETVSDRPNILYSLPYLTNGEPDLQLDVTTEEIEDGFESLHIDEEENIVQQYLSYTKAELGISNPQTWEEGLSMFRRLYQLVSNDN